MPRDGQGQYAPPINNWNPAVDGNEADPAAWNQLLGDISSALSQSVSSDGQTMMTGNANMGGYRIQSLGAPTGNGHALRRDQLIKGTAIASAATIDIPNEGSLFEITGTTTIEHITGAFDGRQVTLLFQDALTIKNGLDVVLPMGADINTNAGLMLQFQRVENNKWSVISYVEATETAPGMQRRSLRQIAGVPLEDEGPVYVVGIGPMEWSSADEKYTPVFDYEIVKWFIPIGSFYEAQDHLAGTDIPPANDPRFRYVKLTASDPYNDGVLINETVTGAAPLLSASADISLVGSPMNGQRIPLINTDERFVGSGISGQLKNDASQNIIANFQSVYMSSLPAPGGAVQRDQSGGPVIASTGDGFFAYNNTFDASRMIRTANATYPRLLRATFYQRIK